MERHTGAPDEGPAPRGDGDSYVVTTDDGVMLSCVRAPLGLGSERRWILRDCQSRRYVGPPAASESSPRAVQRLIASWWRARHVRSLVFARVDSSKGSESSPGRTSLDPPPSARELALAALAFEQSLRGVRMDDLLEYSNELSAGDSLAQSETDALPD